MKGQNLGEIRRKGKEESELWVLGRAKGTPFQAPSSCRACSQETLGPRGGWTCWWLGLVMATCAQPEASPAWPDLKELLAVVSNTIPQGFPRPASLLRPLSKGSRAPRPRGGAVTVPSGPPAGLAAGLTGEGLTPERREPPFPAVLHPTGATGSPSAPVLRDRRLLPYVTELTNPSQARGGPARLCTGNGRMQTFGGTVLHACAKPHGEPGMSGAGPSGTRSPGRRLGYQH